MKFKNPTAANPVGTFNIRSLHEIPRLFSNGSTRDRMAYARFHASWLNKSWYVFEWNGGDRFFGMETENGRRRRRFGLYSLAELRALRGPFAMPIVQDYAFCPARLSELRSHYSAEGK